MDSSPSVELIGVAAVVALLLVNGFFVAAEYAMVRVRRTRLEELAAQGVRAAKYALHVVDHLGRYIATTQLAITMAGIGLGWVGEPVLTGLFSRLLNLPLSALDPLVRRTISSIISFTLITYLTVVLSELVPKSLTINYPERVALLVSRVVVVTGAAFRPFIWLLNAGLSVILRWPGTRSPRKSASAYSVEELKLLLAQSRESGVIEDAEREMLHAVFDFGDLLVRQVMVPRTEMIAVPAEAGLDDVIALAAEQPYTKLPVYEETLDHVVGILHLRDVLLALNGPGPPPGTARELAREVLFTPEAARVSALLQRFRRRRQHVAIVLDEYGGTAGIVTLEDLLEEIVGEVPDTADRPPDFQPLPDGSTLIDGLTLIEEVNEKLNLGLRDPNYDTIAGFVLGKLGRLAQVGDVVTADGVRLRVEAMDGRRIARVSLTPTTPPGRRSPSLPSPS